MDQWEETRDLDIQRNAFRDFLREPEPWAAATFVGVTGSTEAEVLLRVFFCNDTATTEIYTLGELDLADKSEQLRLMTFLRSQPQLRATENVADAPLLELIGGYPRVIDRWTADDAHDAAQTFDGLKQLAREAIAFRYADLERLLIALDGDRRKLAVRVSLVPLAEDAEAWRALRPVVLAGLEPDALDDLKLTNVLEKGAEAPKFGLTTRRYAAAAFLGTHRREAVRAEAEGLILALARSIMAIDLGSIHYASALRDLRGVASRLNLRPLALALCDGAATLFGECLGSLAALIDGARQARELHEPGVGLVLGAALFTTLDPAKLEEGFGRRDALLDELRALATAYPDVAPLRTWLARGLFNMLHEAQVDDDLGRRDTLFDELRALAMAYPDDATVRDQFARGLFEGGGIAAMLPAEEAAGAAACRPSDAASDPAPARLNTSP
jgi:hypothetical protein